MDPDAEEAGNRSRRPAGWRSLWEVLAVQTQNAFNDNLVKYVLIGLAVAAAAGTPVGGNIEFVLSALLPLPFILLAPVAGFLSDRFSKRAVIIGCVIAQTAIFALLATAVNLRSIELGVLGFFLLSVQSTFFSPAKFGILKELVGSERLAVANGFMQTATMLAILGGMFLGGLWFDFLLRQDGDPWRAALIPVGAVGAASLLPLGISLLVGRTPGHPGVRFRPAVFVEHFGDLREIFRVRSLRLTALGIAFYWFVAYFVGLILVGFGKELNPDAARGGVLSDTSYMTGTVGIGLIVGSLIVAVLSRRRIELGMVPVGGIGIAAGLLGTGLNTPGGTGFYLSLSVIGFFSGFFLVPLSAFLQDRADEDERGRVVAAANLLNAFSGIGSIGLGLLLKHAGLRPSHQVLVFVPLTLAATWFVARLLPRNLARFLVSTLVRLVYRIRVDGAGNLPAAGGVLVVANHLTYIDALVLGSACPRDLRFVMFDEMAARPPIRPFVRLFGVIPISSRRARDAIRVVREALARGEAVCVFPEGQMSRTGWLHEVKRGFEMMVRGTGAPIVPANLDGLWGSIFSFAGGRFFPKFPRRIPYRVRVRFGAPVPDDELVAPHVRERLTLLSAQSLAERKGLGEPLDRSLARALGRAPWRPALLAAHTGGRAALNRATVRATAAALAERWAGPDGIPGPRVAVLLPPGSATTLAHLGLVFAGRVPVAVPVVPGTAGHELRRSFESLGIRAAVTTGAVRDALPKDALPPEVRDVGSELHACAGSRLFAGTVKAHALRHVPWLRRGAARPAPDDEALGRLVHRDGEWRLVARTHREITATLHQLGDLDLLRRSTRLATAIAADAPGGWIFGFALPLWAGVPMAPIAAGHVADRLGAVLDASDADWLVTDPAGHSALEAADKAADGSLRARLRLVSTVATLRHPVTTAHQLPVTFDDATDTLVAVSLPDAVPTTTTGILQPGSREGSIGHFPNGVHLREAGDGLLLGGPSVSRDQRLIPCRIDPDGFLVPETTGTAP